MEDLALLIIGALQIRLIQEFKEDPGPARKVQNQIFAYCKYLGIPVKLVDTPKFHEMLHPYLLKDKGIFYNLWLY